MTDDYLRAFSGAVKHDSPNHYPSLKYRSGHHKPKGVATMTRDEAVKTINEMVWENNRHSIGEKWADTFAALGMLKLDEPKSADARFQEIVGRLKFGWKTEELLTAMENAGLKIVEK